MVSVLAAGAAALGLFKYNRKNYMFDSEIRLEREFQGMEMRIKQFEVYREDVRDLVDLTVVKMDRYLIVNTLQMGFCVSLFTEGRPEGEPDEKPPVWLLHIQALCIAGAFMYYLLSVWLAMHASISAHSFGVRLLTQFIRLPLPHELELDEATGLVQDFEGSRLKDILRVPIWKQQIRKLNAAMDEINTDESSRVQSSQLEDIEVHGEIMQPGMEANMSPVAMLQHVKMYRQVQANWQSYDAYARVCMAIGTSQFLHGVCYFLIGALVCKANVIFPAIACVVLLCACAWVLAKLDLYLSLWILRAIAVLLTAPALLVLASACFAKKFNDGHDDPHAYKEITGYKDAWKILMPISYVLHIVWIAFLMRVARPKVANEVALPLTFRSVLYLDVFDWFRESPVGDEETSTEAGRSRHPTDMGLRAAPARRRATGGSGLSTVPEERGGSMRSFGTNDNASVASISAMPRGLQELVLDECRKLRWQLHEELSCWKQDDVMELIQDSTDLLNGSRNAQKYFDDICESLDELPGAPVPLEAPITQQAHDAAPQVWLKLTYNQSEHPIVYYYNCRSQESRVDLPEEPQRISDLRTLGKKMDSLAEKWSLLAGGGSEVSSRGPSLGSTSPSQDLPGSRPTAPAPVPQTPSNVPRTPSPVRDQSSSSSSATPLLESSRPTWEQTSNYQRRQAEQSQEGGTERARLAHSEAVGATFFPGASRHAEGGQPPTTIVPGRIPWHTVQIGSTILLFVWILGLFWIVGTSFFGFRDFVEEKNNVALAAQRVGRLGSPKLVFDGPWPHGFFKLEGLACHPALGDTLFIAERYAVHHLQLSQAALDLRVSSADCIAASPAVQGRGIAGISLDCFGNESECSLVLLGTTGRDGLNCRKRSLHDAEAAHASQRLTFRGDYWKDVASAGANSSVWMLGNDGLVKLAPRHSAQKGESLELVPHADFAHPIVSNLSALAALDQRFLLGLEASGVLHAWPQAGGSSSTWRIAETDNEARWHSLCASGSSLFLAGTRYKDNSAGVWRIDLPQSLTDNSPHTQAIPKRRQQK